MFVGFSIPNDENHSITQLKKWEVILIAVVVAVVVVVEIVVALP